MSIARLPSPRVMPDGSVAWVACLLLCVAVLFAPSPARADELQEVSKLVAAGRLEEADARADAYLAKNPREAQMRFLKGVILTQRGKTAEAIEIYAALNQDYPELPEPYNNLAVVQGSLGHYEKARDALETAIRVSPNYATAYDNLGDVYAALAARSYQDARRLDNSNAAALRKLNTVRTMLALTPVPASALAAPPPVVKVAPPSQRNVGLARPAGAPPAVFGVGAQAPDMIVPSGGSAPSGSNVVAVEPAVGGAASADTSLLAPSATAQASDAERSRPIAAVTDAVQRWADGHGGKVTGLSIRIDGDTAVARFHEEVPTVRSVDRVLTLKRIGDAWGITDEGAQP